MEDAKSNTNQTPKEEEELFYAFDGHVVLKRSGEHRQVKDGSEWFLTDYDEDSGPSPYYNASDREREYDILTIVEDTREDWRKYEREFIGK